MQGAGIPDSLSMSAIAQTSAVPARAWRPLARVATGVSLLAGIGYLAAAHVDLSTLAESDISWTWIAASLVLNLASIAGKAVVWKATLDSLPGERPVRYRHIVPALFVGFLLNTVLFARVGEIARIAVLQRRERLAGRTLARSAIAGTAVAEQIILGVALAITLLALVATMDLPTLAWQLTIAFIAALALIGSLLALALRNAPQRLSAVANGLASGHAILSRPRRMLLAITAGVASWAAQIVGIWAALCAFHIHAGLPAAALIFVASTIVQLFPFWPGNVGMFQLGVYAPLVQFAAVPASTAIAFGVGLQIVEALLGVGLGLAFLANEGLSFGGARRLAASGADAHANEARSHGDATSVTAGDGEGEPDGAHRERAVAQHDAGRSIAALPHLLDQRRVIGTCQAPHVARRREPRETHRHELADPALDANRRTGRQRPDRRR